MVEPWGPGGECRVLDMLRSSDALPASSTTVRGPSASMVSVIGHSPSSGAALGNSGGRIAANSARNGRTGPMLAVRGNPHITRRG
jgi:hypothetical protein